MDTQNGDTAVVCGDPHIGSLREKGAGADDAVVRIYSALR
jgi:hypothetical protein